MINEELVSIINKVGIEDKKEENMFNTLNIKNVLNTPNIVEEIKKLPDDERIMLIDSIIDSNEGVDASSASFYLQFRDEINTVSENNKLGIDKIDKDPKVIKRVTY